MADRADRFRRLRAGAGETGDLFEHFGVAIGPTVAPMAPPGAQAAVEAAPCGRCGWLLAYRRDEPGCPMCGDPDPLSRVEAQR